ncbi:hypothetical protein Psi02_46490 [Planotetraspora silvatica]|uniref:Uncharacterized protein n=2 Tax=Planotetraspora silvatica TaxID=234614 RepID=A0A8J3V1G4_9ACTN|nr:hypothetical protein Psi02_46490 [Planotetraspora silvatica]
MTSTPRSAWARTAARVADGEAPYRVRTGVEGEMHVGVDQPGEQRHVAEIDQVRAGRDGAAMPYGHDAAPFDDHDGIPAGKCLVAVEQTSRSDGLHRVVLFCGWPV